MERGTDLSWRLWEGLMTVGFEPALAFDKLILGDEVGTVSQKETNRG